MKSNPCPPKELTDPYSFFLEGATDPHAPKYGRVQDQFKDASMPLMLGRGVHFKWQKKAFARLKDAAYSLLVACCGSGKTTVQIFLAIYDILEKRQRRVSQKQLVIVPQNHIHKGFCSFSKNGKSTEYLSIRYQNTRTGKSRLIEWKIPSVHNFCSRKSKTVNALKKFLLAESLNEVPEVQISENIAVATHRAMSLAWAGLTHAQKLKAIQHLTLRIDEAHHVRGVTHPDDLAEYLIDDPWHETRKTGIGKVCEFILKHNEGTSKICLTTATPFRGDKEDIISSQYMKDFKVFRYDWIDHWKTLQLSGFDFGYQVYNKDPIGDVAKNIREESKERHIVYIPPRRQKYRDERTVQRYVQALTDRGLKRERILDLVTEGHKIPNKRRLVGAPLSLDTVIAVRLMDEGSDWPPASRIHNTHNEQSLSLSLQRMGRLFRFFKRKKDIKIVNYIPKFRPIEGDQAREALSDRFNCILLVLQMEEFLKPVEFPCTPTPENPTKVERVNLVEKLGQEVYDNLIDYVYKNYDNLKVKDPKHIEALLNRAVQKHVPKRLREKNPNLVKILGVKLSRRYAPKIAREVMSPSFLREHFSFDKIWPEKGPDSLYLGVLEPLTEQEFHTIKRLTSNWREQQKIEAMVKEKEQAQVKSSTNNLQESCLPAYQSETLTIETILRDFKEEKGKSSRFLSKLAAWYGGSVIRRNGLMPNVMGWLGRVKIIGGPVEVLKALYLLEQVRDWAEKRGFPFSIHNGENDQTLEKMIERTAFKVRDRRFFLYGRPHWDGKSLKLKMEHQSGDKIVCSLNNLHTWSKHKKTTWIDYKIWKGGENHDS